MPRLFFAECIGETRPSVSYPERERKRKGLERVCMLLLESKAKPLPPKQSVKFKCQMWSKITNDFARKDLDTSSLRLGKKHKC